MSDLHQSHVVITNIATIPKVELASLHLKYLPTDFTDGAGHKLLELYYAALAQAEDAFGWAAVVHEKTAGFACAVHSQKSIQRLLFKKAPLQVLYWSLRQVVQRPEILGNFLRRLVPAASVRGQWQRPATWNAWYTYRPLVVDEVYRKYRLADILTQQVIAEAQRRGVPGLVSIVARVNSAARVTHVRHGFREAWKDSERIIFVKEVQP